MVGLYLQGQPLTDLESQLEQKVNQARSSSQKVKALLDLADFYNRRMYNEVRADSLYRMAIFEAESSYNQKLIFQTCKHFLENIPNGYDRGNCGPVCKRILDLAESMEGPNYKYEGYKITTIACLKSTICESEGHYASMALSEANKNNNIHQKIEAMLLHGRVVAKSGNIADALSQVLTAKELMETLSDSEKYEHIFQYDQYMYEIYEAISDVDKAYKHLTNQIEYLISKKNIDSLQLMEKKLDLTKLSYKNDRDAGLKLQFEDIISFSKRNNYSKLFNYSLSIYRSWLIKHLKFGELNKLMKRDYPESLEQLKTNDLGWYYNVLAFIIEPENPDSARIYYNKAKEYVLSSTNTGAKAYFFNRFGEFEERRGEHSQAIQLFEKGYTYAIQSDLIVYQEKISTSLERLYFVTGNHEKAYSYAKVNQKLMEAKNNSAHQNKLIEMVVKSEQRQKEINQELAAAKKKKKHNMQYSIIVLVLVVVFFFVVIISSLAVPEWLIEMLAFFSVLSIF